MPRLAHTHRHTHAVEHTHTAIKIFHFIQLKTENGKAIEQSFSRCLVYFFDCLLLLFLLLLFLLLLFLLFLLLLLFLFFLPQICLFEVSTNGKAEEVCYRTAPRHCSVVTPSSDPTSPPPLPLSNCLSTFIGAAHLHRIKLIINMATGQVADPIPTTSKNKLLLVLLLPERKKN